jgi:hypothetical protein
MSSFFSTHRPPNIPCSKPSPIPWKWWTISNYIAYFQLGTPWFWGIAQPQSDPPPIPREQKISGCLKMRCPPVCSHGYFTITLVSKIIIKWGFRGYSISQKDRKAIIVTVLDSELNCSIFFGA